MDRIVNEAVLETVLPTTRKLSVVLRCQGDTLPTTPSLRRYVGEIYSQLWDCSLAGDSMELSNPDLPDVVVYPQNLPNAAPESWIDIQPDLDCVCSHDAITGWSSTYASSSSSFRQAQRYATKAGNGQGGLDEHVDALNAERRQRGLKPVFALHTQNPITSILTERDPDVVFLDDEEQEEDGDIKFNQNDENCDVDSMNTDDSDEGCILAGSRLTSRDKLYESVCVGGTFDGMHFGHRKLLTLAVSSVEPVTGRLLVGITVDEMLRHKKLAEFIPPYAQRCQSVRDFLYRLAPGMTNRIRIQPISDSFGPPGQPNSGPYDALVLSHETLETGRLLNRHRVQQLKLPPLKLLCTRRTEVHGMSSTALRKMRNQIRKEQRVLKEL
jgi:cytidyltransferase-like protein